jgi:hypothetical protein
MLFSAPTTDSGWTDEALPILPNEKSRQLVERGKRSSLQMTLWLIMQPRRARQ